MSKEKQCECCHEWWYGSDVKENLCPNCYDYFKQLKQQLKEKDNLIEFGKEEIRKRNKRIDEIVERDKKLFDNKNKEIEKLRKILNFQNINAGIDIKEMWADLFIKQVDKNKQLAIQELEKVKIQLKDKIKMMSNEEHCYQQKVVNWHDICDQINKQIKELKGEKDVKD